jgi:hypothetical protein
MLTVDATRVCMDVEAGQLAVDIRVARTGADAHDINGS